MSEDQRNRPRLFEGTEGLRIHTVDRTAALEKRVAALEALIQPGRPGFGRRLIENMKRLAQRGNKAPRGNGVAPQPGGGSEARKDSGGSGVQRCATNLDLNSATRRYAVDGSTVKIYEGGQLVGGYGRNDYVILHGVAFLNKE